MSVPTTLYDKIMRIIQGPHFGITFLTKLNPLGYETRRDKWISGETATAAVGLEFTDEHKAAIEGRLKIARGGYDRDAITENNTKDIDIVGAYIIMNLINQSNELMSYNQFDVLRNMALKNRYSNIKDVLNDNESKIVQTKNIEFRNPLKGGGRRSRKVKKTRKANNKRRSQRNRK